MKLLVLGIGGSMAGMGTRFLQELPDALNMFTKVTVSDIDYEAAKKVAAELKFENVDALHLDVTDTEKLTRVARDYDLVFNGVGPYTVFGVPTLKAIIEAGTDYIDVMDEGDVTPEMYKLDEAAKEAGVTAIIGMGQSPGSANMQAKLVAEQMDSIDSMKIIWAYDAPNVDMVRGTDQEEYMTLLASNFTDIETVKKLTPAGYEHMLSSCGSDLIIWKDGKYDRMPAWDSGEYIDFPEPLGRIPAYYIGHPEPVTLPKYIEIKDFCACLGTVVQLEEEYRLAARGYRKAKNPPVKPTTPQYEGPEVWHDKGVYAGQAIVAEGMKDGQKVRYTNRLMCGVTDPGIYYFGGQSVGMYLMAKHRDLPKGVISPEGIFDTAEYFEYYTGLMNKMNGWDMSLEEMVPTQKEVLE